MLNKYFVNQGLKEVQIEKFIREKFPEGNYSHMELQRTPLGIKVVIYSSSPGKIIGRGGKNINEMTDALKEKFSLENPQLDVKSVPRPDLDAKIVAKNIALTLERGFNFKRMGNIMMKKIMGAGAIGVEIVISGRMSGGKSMTAKFIDGYLKHSGEPSKTLVDVGFEEIYRIGKTKPGKIGIRVKIMTKFQTITGEIKHSMAEIKPKATTVVGKDKSSKKEKIEKTEKAEKKKKAKKPVEKKAKKPEKPETEKTEKTEKAEKKEEKSKNPEEIKKEENA